MLFTLFRISSFWYGYGSADTQIQTTGLRIRILLFSPVTFKRPTKSKLFLRTFLLITYHVFTSVFKDAKLLRSLKTVEIIFSKFFACWWKDLDPEPDLEPDPDQNKNLPIRIRVAQKLTDRNTLREPNSETIFERTFSPPPFLLSGKDVRGPEVCPTKILHKQVQGAAGAEINRGLSYKASGRRLLRETGSQIPFTETSVRLAKKNCGIHTPQYTILCSYMFPVNQDLWLSYSQIKNEI
jgi:hypothetical protein